MTTIKEIKNAKKAIDKVYDRLDHIDDDRIPKKRELMEGIWEDLMLLDDIEKRINNEIEKQKSIEK